jgi:adenosine deaminase
MGRCQGGFCHTKVAEIIARELNIPFTIHAGEAGPKGWRVRSIKWAIKFGAKRIGHGIALEHSPELRELCKKNGIGIECCPVSNLQTKAVEGGIKNHPLPQFLKEGLLVSVNTDNRTVSNTNLEKEFTLLRKVGISKTEQKQLMLNAIKMSFTDDATKLWLRTFID